MKYIALTGLFLLSIYTSAQTSLTISGTADIDDANLVYLHGDDVYQHTNYATSASNRASSWTKDGTQRDYRAILKFDCSDIPVNSQITSATITFRTDASWSGDSEINSSYTSSNELYIERVTSDWSETSVTWASQPATTTSGRIYVGASTSTHETLVVDITEMTRYWVENPSSNYGFMMKLVNEIYYAARNYGSSENTSYAPVIDITYGEPFQVMIPYAESWESSDGGWYSSEAWTRLSGETPSSNTGPGDAVDGSYYYYLEASSPNYPNETFLLYGPMYENTNGNYYPVSFSYHMYGASMGTLSLQRSIDSGASWEVVWSMSGDQGDQWHDVTIEDEAQSLNADATVWYRFSGYTGSSYTGDMAIDDFKISIPTITASPPYSQSWESSDGGWFSTGAWTRDSGGTPSSSTGPSDADDGSYYFYLEASSPNNPDKEFILYGPESKNASGYYYPVSFSYHMHGASMGTLYLERSIDYGDSWTVAWSRSGDQGDRWHKAAVVDESVYLSNSVPLWYRFRGVTGSSYTGDMAIDDFTFSETLVWYDDSDGDKMGDPTSSILSASRPDGYVIDADDGCPTIAGWTPGVSCEDYVPVYYDLDHDGYGGVYKIPDVQAEKITTSEGALLHYIIEGIVYLESELTAAGWSLNMDDCNDGDPDIVGLTWYADTDGDGLGDLYNPIAKCEQPDGYVANADDGCPTIAGWTPGVSCKDYVPVYYDSDHDGYGGVYKIPDVQAEKITTSEGALLHYIIEGIVYLESELTAAGWSLNMDDCNDGDPDIGGLTWYADIDGDGLGDLYNPIAKCEQPDGYVANADDCDDTDALVGVCLETELVHQPTYNGNISAIRWQGVNDEEPQLYAYAYDGLNRLTSARYAAGEAHTSGKDHHSVPYLAYDLNGNIQQLIRHGPNLSGVIDEIDNLTYNYGTGGNQLAYVADSKGSVGFDDGNSGQDYLYDDNGNMIQDLNKGITDIEYNYLNLPGKVVFDASNYIEYLYDAAGVKLKQTVYEEGVPVKTTDYVGAYIYEDQHDGSGKQLQFIQHEEGRIVPKYGSGGHAEPVEAYDYQYHLKDHLGNVRVTFSTTPEHYTMTETFETGEENGWQDLHRHTNTNANTTDYDQEGSPGDEVELLQSGMTGAMIFLSLNKGDTIDLSVQANYEAEPTNTNWVPIAESALFSSWNTAYGGLEATEATESVFGQALTGATMAGKDDGSTTAPMAFLNFIFFDKDMQYEAAGFKQISTAARGIGIHEPVQLDEPFIADQEGYILAYLSNENQEAVNVHFDDFTVYHGKTNIVSASDYYPGGATFNDYKRTASEDQNFKFNQGTGDKKFLTERIPELQVDMTKYRMYDYWTLRFLQVDPKADLAPQESWTPYHYAFNNPIRYNDPYGDCPKCWEGLKRLFVDPIVNANRRAAEKRAVYGSGTSSGPTKNITGNYFGDAVYKLAGGETFQKAANGNVKAQGQVIMGTISSLGGAKSKVNVGDDASSATSKYSKLVDSKSVGPGKKFTTAQKKKILSANREANNGVLKSDMSGEVLDQPVQSQKGVPANMNQAEVDHIDPKSKGGSNSFKNAQVLSKKENLEKRDN